MEGNLDHLNLSSNPKFQRHLSRNGDNSSEATLFSANVQKINKRDRHQDRILEEIQRQIPLEELHGVTYNTANEEFILHVSRSYDYFYKSARRPEVVALLQREVSSPFYIWEKNMQSIKRYVTQKSDMKKGVSVIPPISEALNRQRSSSVSVLPQQNPLDEYEILRQLGQGKTGIAFLAKSKGTKETVVLKHIRKDQTKEQVGERERAIICQMLCPFVVKIFSMFESQNDIILVMEYLQGQTLEYHINRLRKFTEESARFYACQVLLGLARLHEYGIVYRDLSPRSVLLDLDGHAHLADFSLSKAIDPRTQCRTYIGSPEYLAPEVISLEGYGFAADWWSFGALLFHMLMGISPFYNQNLPLMHELIKRGELRFTGEVSAEARDLLQRLLTRDQSSRLGSRGAPEVQAHPFFRSINWQMHLQRTCPAPLLDLPAGYDTNGEESLSKRFGGKLFETFSV